MYQQAGPQAGPQPKQEEPGEKPAGDKVVDADYKVEEDKK
jgi:hypothetical protein